MKAKEKEFLQNLRRKIVLNTNIVKIPSIGQAEYAIKITEEESRILRPIIMGRYSSLITVGECNFSTERAIGNGIVTINGETYIPLYDDYIDSMRMIMTIDEVLERMCLQFDRIKFDDVIKSMSDFEAQTSATSLTDMIKMMCGIGGQND